tara:strand:+ start:31 stop:459 length:429 start_codon:yes stop_codon:yes gene_type:complete
MDIALFRQNFPEFTDTVRYPTAMISFWASVGEAQLIKRRWGTLYDPGLSLFVAHEVTLAEERFSTATDGATPGTEAGAETSRHVDLATVQYDGTSASEKGAGHWNQTAYGRQYFSLLRMVGAGGQFVGASCRGSTSYPSGVI